MPSNLQTTDVAIIGAGPVGLFAIFECGMLKMRCHVVDSLDVIGGQCAALYPEKPIYDIPGYPRVMAQELIDRLTEQAAPFEPVYHLGQQVTALSQSETGRWRLTTAKGTEIDAAAVIIAAGCGAFGPNRPPLTGIEDYEGTSVHYLVQRREDFRGKRIVIAGGGDSAVDWALSLAELAEKIHVVHRRPKFRAAPESIDRLHRLAESEKLDLVIPYQLAGLQGSGGQLTAVEVADLEGHKKALPADVLLPFFGLSMNLGPIADWGLNLDHQHITVEPATSETSAKGIFAVGDIAVYPGKLKLILSGFSEAAMAAHAIRPLVYPDEALHWEYSTTRGVPQSAQS
ncbi:NAD(P)/FAD-dependent oxidoreductase [Pelagibius litoralis]|uniref:Ferredoxin--NADP reductase n=1 Tax=Pelagibius litoralis TaxID=374515 RepID=A0A967C5V2_9PROT|nr:NAD(P)/FAD-dependent oxidoreductase [Pelagibius litoralis]NIA68006.1 NAD(P)/FAD-dependent oxidoreductase [Pelagibius litoralis]